MTLEPHYYIDAGIAYYFSLKGRRRILPSHRRLCYAIAITRPPPPLFWLTLARQYSTVKLALCLTRLADPQPCPINRLPRTAGVPGFRCLTLIGSIILTLNCRCQRLDLYFDPYVCLYQPFVLNFSFPTEVFTIKCEALFVLVYNRN